MNFAAKVNVLFIPDGFQIGEKDLFRQIADRIVKKLQSDVATFPYNELKNSINYWRLEDADFFPSVDQNVSVLAELDLVGRRTSRGKLVPFPVKPPASATFWTLEHMVYMVGLPVPSDARTVAQLKTLYDIVESKIRPKVLNEWRGLGDRKVINERDTAFGIALNDHPRVDLDANPVATFHERRTTADQFATFVEALQNGSTTVGTTWTTGKDKGLVCLVARSERMGGSQEETHFCFTLARSTEDRLQAATGGHRGIDLIPMELTARGRLIDLGPAVVPTVAHECAHAFGLMDEYGGGLFFPPNRRSDLLGKANVQPASEIIPATASTIDQDGVRWRLPRIKAAGVLNGAPAPSGVDFIITLVTMRFPRDFAKDDIVRLRKRDFLADPTLNSNSFVIHDVALNHVSINPFVGTTITAGDFPAGSQLIATNSGAVGMLTSEPSPSFFGGNVLDVELRTGQAGNFSVGNAVVLRKTPFSGRFKVTEDPLSNQITITPLAGDDSAAFVFCRR